MAEIMEEKKELTPAETAAPASPETPAKKPEKSTADKKKRRRTIRRIVALLVVAALIAGGVAPPWCPTVPSAPRWTAAVW